MALPHEPSRGSKKALALTSTQAPTSGVDTSAQNDEQQQPGMLEGRNVF